MAPFPTPDATRLIDPAAHVTGREDGGRVGLKNAR
jgi:hypothetical protein